MIYSRGNGNCETKQVHWDDQSQLHHLLTSVFVGRRLVKVLLPPVFELGMQSFLFECQSAKQSENSLRYRVWHTHTHTQKQIINIWPTKITLKSLPLQVAENNVMCHFPHSVAFHPNRVGWRNKHFDGQPNFRENGMCPKKHGRNRRFVQKKKH